MGSLTVAPSAVRTAANATVAPRWANLTPSSGPPGVMSAAMTYDAADGYVLAFGGLVDGNATNQTWEFHDGAWTNLTANVGVAPSPRYDMAMTYDAADGYVLAFGGLAAPHNTPRGPSCAQYEGFPGCPLNDTWTYLNGSWTALHPTCEQWNGTAALPYDCVQLVGGPDQMVYDAHDGYVLKVDYFTPPNGYTNAGIDPTWSFQNGSWIRDFAPSILHAPFNMDPAGIGALAYDAADGVVVAFGSGTNGFPHWSQGPLAVPASNNATYTYSNYTWTLLSPNVTAPPPRFGEGLSYDSEDGYVLLYGGWNWSVTCTPPNATYDCQYSVHTLNDTWTFHNGTWTNLSGGSSPASLGNSRLIDDLGDRTVLQAGGWSCGTTTCGYPGGGWFCDGENSSLEEVVFPCLGTGTADVASWAWGTTPPLESPSITATRTAVTAGIPVNFTVSYRDGGPNVTFLWEFGDGTNATTQNVTHLWTTAGLYTVRVWVNDSANHSVIAATPMTVGGALGTVPTAAPDPTDVGLPVQFTSGPVNGTPPYRYAWSFGDGNTSALRDPAHGYGANGTYTVNLTVADSGGAATNSTLVLVVHPALTVVLNVTPVPADLGQLVNFSANVSGGTSPYTFSWAFGDGGIGGNLSNISHIYTTNGPFDPAVEVTDAAGQSVTVAQALVIALNVSILPSAVLGAAPLGLGFTSHVVGGEPGYTYAWSFGDGGTSALADPSHVYATPGAFSASLEVTDAAGATARSAAWTVLVAAGGGPLTLALDAAPRNVSLGAVETVTAVPQGGAGAYTLTWTSVPPGCSTNALLTLRCPTSVTGTYQVGATLTDARGGVANASASFTVGPTTFPRGTTGTGPNGSSAGLSLFAQEAIAGVAIGGLVAAAIAGFSLGLFSRRYRGPGPGSRDPYDRFRRPEPARSAAAEDATALDGTDPLNDLL